MTIQKLPLVGLDDLNHQRRTREAINQIIDVLIESEFIATVAAGTGGSPTGTVKYRLANRVVTLWIDTALSVNASTGNTLTLSTLPPELRPRVARAVRCAALTDLNTSAGGCNVGTDGVLTFFVEDASGSLVTGNSSGFDASGSPKGLQAGWTISYPL